MEQINSFISKARADGFNDDDIRVSLTESGWPKSQIDAALNGQKAHLLQAPIYSPSRQGTSDKQPTAVVQNLTTRGLEYNIMFLSLFISATSLGLILHNFISASESAYGDGFLGSTTTFFWAAILVSSPILVTLFMRLRKAEATDSNLHNDPTRKKAVQSVLVVAFIVGMIHIIIYVYNILNASSDTEISIINQTLHILVTLLIAGGIFTYYWLDEHNQRP